MPTDRSAQLTAAIEAAAKVPLCPECPQRSGLCTSCGRTVLPQLRQPAWHRDAHRGGNYNAEQPRSAEGDRVRRRKASRARTRLARALAGQFTPSRPAAA